MAEVKETGSITPVLPASKWQRVKREQPKQQQRQARDKQQRPDPDEGVQHVDEYA